DEPGHTIAPCGLLCAWRIRAACRPRGGELSRREKSCAWRIRAACRPRGGHRVRMTGGASCEAPPVFHLSIVFAFTMAGLPRGACRMRYLVWILRLVIFVIVLLFAL